MTCARHTQTSPEIYYYHCITRCVRRAWLCGRGAVSGKDYSHRKDWLVQRWRELAGIFAIDIAAYAVLDNHYHVVLHRHPERAQRWTPQDVIARWKRLYHGQQATPDDQTVHMWRSRLIDLSWFMREVN